MESHHISNIHNPFSNEITDSDLLLYHGTSVVFKDQILCNGFSRSFDTYNEYQIKQFCDEVVSIQNDLKDTTNNILDKYQNATRTRTSFTSDFERACYYALDRKGGLINNLINQIFKNLDDDSVQKLKQNHSSIFSLNNKLNNSDCVIFAIVLSEELLSLFSVSPHGAIHLDRSLQSNFIVGLTVIEQNLNPTEPDNFIDIITRNSAVFKRIESQEWV